MRAIQALAVSTILALGACTGDEGVVIEGDDAGECSDGADNDQDGYFDCDDQGCWGSPDCGDDPNLDDTGQVGGESCAEGSGAQTYPSFSAMEIEYTYEVDIYPPLDSFYPDCVMTFVGEGGSLGGHGPFALAQGSWTRTSSTCHPDMEAFVWAPDDGEAFHTVRFGGSGELVESWTVHAERSDCEPDGTERKFWTSEMSAEIGTGGRAEYNYGGELVDGGQPIGNVAEQLVISFFD